VDLKHEQQYDPLDDERIDDGVGVRGRSPHDHRPPRSTTRWRRPPMPVPQIPRSIARYRSFPTRAADAAWAIAAIGEPSRPQRRRRSRGSAGVPLGTWGAASTGYRAFPMSDRMHRAARTSTCAWLPRRLAQDASKYRVFPVPPAKHAVVPSMRAQERFGVSGGPSSARDGEGAVRHERTTTETAP
jgi:hypothetical protein